MHDAKWGTITVTDSESEENTLLGTVTVAGSRELGVMMIADVQFVLSVFELVDSDVPQQVLLHIEEVARSNGLAALVVPMALPTAWLFPDLMKLGFSSEPTEGPANIYGVKASGSFRKRLQ